MLWAVAVVLGVLWVLALGSSHAFGSYIHVLLVASIGLASYRILFGRKRGAR
jgi:hypothetical protein